MSFFSESVQRLSRLLSDLDRIEADFQRAAEAVENLYLQGGKLLACGNGGSAAEAAHLTSELVGRFREDRPALPAICLSSESSALTAIPNDYGYEHLFVRQIEAYGKPGDLLVCFSTSGNSANLIAAAQAARQKQLTTLSLLGKSGGELKAISDIAVVVPCDETARIQEVHQLMVHALCEGIERRLGYA